MYNSWQSCENCADKKCFETLLKDHHSLWKLACPDWKPIRCRCGGALSTTREYKGRKYRHCYSCHAEFFEEK